MKRIYIFTICICSLIGLSAQDSDIVLPSIISDHAVMQRDAEVKLWGWCPSVWDLKIVCSWATTDTIHVIPDKYCAWETYIRTPKEAGPHSIRFYGWENKLYKEVKDILMGETWLCSGQSNMEYSFRWRIDDAGELTSVLNNSQIRIFKVSKAASKNPVERMEGKWEICSPETSLDFSAVGLFFGNQLNKTLNVPVGLIGSYWGGTAIEPWIDEFSYHHEKELFEKSQNLDAGWTPTANSSIYNAMIHPIVNYTIAGVIWYQGEANNERASDYGILLDGMIRGWRNTFHRFLPFYFVQIAPWNGYAGRNAAYLREQQADVASTLKNTGMVAVGDLVNDVTDIHPSLKRQVGERLANMALKETYGMESLQPYSPTFKSLKIEGRKAIVRTTAIGKLICKGKDVENFEMVAKDGNIYPAQAEILKNGDICVTSNKVKEPAAVLYCFTNGAIPDLFDVNGLPLAPFRTDRKLGIYTHDLPEQKNAGIHTPHFTGSFIQEFLVANWNDARWDQEMTMLKEAGMKYLIYAPALLVDENGKTTTYYPSSLVKKNMSRNTIEKCLRSAKKHGIKLFVGMNFNDRWWKVDYDLDWLVGQMEIGNKVADELVTLYKEKYGDTMYGWYWTWEVDNLNCMTADRQAALATALNTNLDHLSKITPDMPFMLSPFMNHKVGGNAEEYGKMWENVFAQTHFRTGDIFSPQDCVGAGGLNLDNLREWFSKLKQAVNTKPGLKFWGNVETFDQRFWVSASMDRIQKQMEIVNGYVSNLICFAYSHYNSPYVVHEDYHQAYLEYFRNGKLPEMVIPHKVMDATARKTTKGIEIKWIPGSLDAVSGYSIYKDNVLIKRIQMQSGKALASFTDEEGNIDSLYEIAAYNAIGNESERVKAEPGQVSMTKAQLADKIKGGWAAKTIGCTYGGPVEFLYNGTMIQDYTPIPWSKDRVKFYFDTFPGLYDDLYVDIIFVNVFERLGLDAPAESFAIDFANAGFPLWHANQVAKYNIKQGIMPPMSGHWLNNPHADDIDYQIEADFAGLMSPGMPNTASGISDKVGHIFTYGDGWYGGVYVGALYAMAFVSDNMEEVVEKALKTIPEQSDFYQCVNDILGWYKQYPNDWKQTWFECERKWSSEVGCPDGVFVPFNIDAKINSAYVTIGLLYGQKDFHQTMDIAARCGQDSDCNAATSAGVLGTMLGYSNIPEIWKESLYVVENIPFDYTEVSLNTLYELGLKHALKVIEKEGGSVTGEQVTIQVQKPVAVRYEKSFDGHYPAGKVAVNLSLQDKATVEFTGIGFVQKGHVKCMDEDYVAKVEISVDGGPAEAIHLPVAKATSIDNRRVDLFHKYQMPDAKHEVSFIWLNPRKDVQVYLGEAVIYSNEPNQLIYK